MSKTTSVGFGVLYALLVLAGCGCHTVADRLPKWTAPTSQPVVADRLRYDAITYCQNIRFSELAWRDLILARFENPVVVIGHGGDLDGVWHVFPDGGRDPMPVSAVAWAMHDAFPGRPVVLLICNHEGHDLDTPGVFYARTDVWSIPDAVARRRHASKDDAAGSFDEFYTRGEPLSSPVR